MRFQRSRMCSCNTRWRVHISQTPLRLFNFTRQSIAKPVCVNNEVAEYFVFTLAVCIRSVIVPYAIARDPGQQQKMWQTLWFKVTGWYLLAITIIMLLWTSSVPKCSNLQKTNLKQNAFDWIEIRHQAIKWLSLQRSWEEYFGKYTTKAE